MPFCTYRNPGSDRCGSRVRRSGDLCPVHKHIQTMERANEAARKVAAFDWLETQSVTVYNPPDVRLVFFRDPRATGSLLSYVEETRKAIEDPSCD